MGIELPDLRVYIHAMSRIQVSPEVHFGKPCVAGTRIPVHAVLELVRDGIPPETIIRDYYPVLKGEASGSHLNIHLTNNPDRPAIPACPGRRNARPAID